MTDYDEFDDGADADVGFEQPLEIPEEFHTLSSEWRRMTVRELWSKYTAGELDPQPDYQREYVWNNERASRYIESLLLEFPTPPIFLSEEIDGKWVVIDGHQRLTTLFKYMQPLLRDAPVNVSLLEPLTLSNLEVLPTLNATRVEALSLDQRERLWNTDVSIVLLPKDVHPDMKYSLFARLNQGSVNLNPQELRNCLYRGAYNDFIRIKSEEREFLDLYRMKTPDKRMKHRERLLRFYALLHRIGDYRTPFRAFLNDEIETHRNLSREERDRFEEELNHAILWTTRVFSKNAFFRFEIGNADNPDGRWIHRTQDLIADLEMVHFAKFGKALDDIWLMSGEAERDFLILALRRSAINVMISPTFPDLLRIDTTRVTTLRKRFDRWSRAMNGIVTDTASAIKQTQDIHHKFAQSSACVLCPHQLDEAEAVLSKDGQQLAHIYCRRHR